MSVPFTLDIPYILSLGPPQDPPDIPLQRPYITPLPISPTRGPESMSESGSNSLDFFFRDTHNKPTHSRKLADFTFGFWLGQMHPGVG